MAERLEEVPLSPEWSLGCDVTSASSQSAVKSTTHTHVSSEKSFERIKEETHFPVQQELGGRGNLRM